MDILKALLLWWFVAIPAIAVAVAAFLVVVGILGAPIWLLIWWIYA